MRASRRLGRSARALLVVVAALVAAGASAGIARGQEGAPAPTLASDRATYAPGETVELSGANWLPGQSVHLHVADGGGHGWSHDADVLAGADGTISDAFQLPSDFGASFAAVATSALGGSANASFTSVFAAPASPPTVVSDKADYRPGETVTLTGSNWAPGESIHIVVNDDEGQSWSRTVDVTADAAGTFRDQFQLPTSFVAVYSVTATGAESGTARTTFTDGNVGVTPSPATVTFTLKWTEYDGTNQDPNTTCTGTIKQQGPAGGVTVSSGSAFSNGVGNNNALLLEASANAVSPAGSTFVNWTGVAGATFVQSGAFDPTDSPRVICIPASSTSNRDYVANYTAGNRAPIAVNDSFSVAEDDTLTVAAPGVLANDTDADGNPLSAVLVSGPAHGVLTLNANGSFTYTPAANYNGSDSFTYKANDGTADSNVATVSITVTPVNDAPVAANDSYSTNEDMALTVAAPGVLANDSDVEGSPLSAVLVSGPAHGTLTLNANGSFTYTPAANYNGSDSFTYKANDGTADSNLATVSIAVTAVNDAPLAVDDSYSTAEDTPLTVSAPGVLANDSDVEGSALSAVLVSGPAHGTLTLNANGSLTYTPAADYHGPDSFTYRASDGSAQSAVATVSITVDAVNDAPVGTADSYSVAEDGTLTVPAPGVLANDTDVDGDALTVAAPRPTSGPSNGGLTLSANGSFTYTPDPDFNGSDSFTYKANDGTVDSAAATVSITVTEVNDVPAAVADSVTVAEDGSVTFDPRANDSKGPANESGQTLTVTALGTPAHGTAAVVAGGVKYTPDADYNGPDGFSYTVTDDGATNGAADAKSDSATVSVTVTEGNDKPVAVNDAKTTAEDTPLVFAASSLAINDSPGPANESGQTLTVTSVQGAVNGSVSLASGQVTFAPDPDFNGAASFTYTVIDNGTTNGAADPKTDTATVNVTVSEINDPPDAVNDSASVAEDSATGVLVDVLANDTEGPANEGGQTLTISGVGSPSHGTAVHESGNVRYTPAANYFGPDSFTYTITDDGTTDGAADPKADTATVNITVTAVNDAPDVTAGPNVSGNEGAPVSVSATFSDVEAGDTHTCSVNWGDSTTSGGTVNAADDTCTASHTYVDDNPTATPSDDYTVTVTITDDGTTNGSPDAKSRSATLKATIANVAPAVTNVSGPPAPVAVSSAGVSITTNFTDAGSQDTHRCTYAWDDGTPDTTVIAPGTGNGSCSASHTYAAAGVYTVGVTVADDDTGTATAKYEFVVVYDPSGGFVTGGGWINSAAGSYRLDPALTGKANFGFVSKYKKGATAPEGQTEFQFHAAGLNFHSEAYQWLVVAGSKAQYKGTGEINGVTGFGFLLTATDGSPDKFRIKIWKLSDNSVVYDNKFGTSDDIDAADPQAIASGSIVVHK